MSIAVRLLPLRKQPAEREAWAAQLQDRFAPIASALGLLFVLVVIGENLAGDGSSLRGVFLVAGWAIWGVFVAEFILRAVVALRRPGGFLRKNWWQVTLVASHC